MVSHQQANVAFGDTGLFYNFLRSRVQQSVSRLGRNPPVLADYCACRAVTREQIKDDL